MIHLRPETDCGSPMLKNLSGFELIVFQLFECVSIFLDNEEQRSNVEELQKMLHKRCDFEGKCNDK